MVHHVGRWKRGRPATRSSVTFVAVSELILHGAAVVTSTLYRLIRPTNSLATTWNEVVVRAAPAASPPVRY